MSADQPSPERQFAEEFGVIGERVGMPRMVARVLGWMLICDPPRPVDRRPRARPRCQPRVDQHRDAIAPGVRAHPPRGCPGSRGYTFEIEPSFFAGQMNAANPFGLLRQVLDRGVTVAGGEDNPRAARLREARDFYAFVEKAVPEVIERYRAGRERKEASHE